MPALDPAPCPSASLNAKELEVLRLLAAGHTVKSIAVRLGRTETSINERLRDARRKTGFGSSRELARRLDTQKIWDKNFDLSPERSLADGLRQPPDTGRAISKGTFAMLLVLPIAAAALVMAGADSVDRPAEPQRADAAAANLTPLVGSWSLDVMRVPAAERPRRVTIRFAVGANRKWTTQVVIVSPDGTTRHAESTAALDGVAVPITGTMDFIDSASLRQSAPNTLVMTLGKGGVAVSTRVYAVAGDGKSMTETIIWSGQSLPRLETNHFNRID